MVQEDTIEKERGALLPSHEPPFDSKEQDIRKVSTPTMGNEGEESAC